MVLLLCPPAVSRLLNVKADSPRCCNRMRQLVVAVPTTCTVVQSVDASIDPCTCMCLHTVYMYYTVYMHVQYICIIQYTLYMHVLYICIIQYTLYMHVLYICIIQYTLYMHVLYICIIQYTLYMHVLYYMYYTVYSSFWEGYAGCDVRTYTRCHFYLLSLL